MMDLSNEEKNGMTKEILLSIFDYSDGVLIWKEPDDIKGSKTIYKSKDGYKRVRINGIAYLHYRLVFLFHKGYIPKYINHRNRIRDDDHIGNLRECTSSQNAMNRKISSINTSGIKGVTFIGGDGKCWRACLMLHKKYVFNKTFHTSKEAIEALNKARAEHHGEFANNGN